MYRGITDYSGSKNRFGKELWEMKDLIKKSGSYFQGPNAEDMKRICLAVAMLVRTASTAHAQQLMLHKSNVVKLNSYDGDRGFSHVPAGR